MAARLLVIQTMIVNSSPVPKQSPNKVHLKLNAPKRLSNAPMVDLSAETPTITANFPIVRPTKSLTDGKPAIFWSITRSQSFYFLLARL